MALRRKGFSWETIIKVTGHRDAVTLVKNYDLTLEGPGRVLGKVKFISVMLILPSGLAELAGAIGNGPLVAIGNDVPLVKIARREDMAGSTSSGSQQVEKVSISGLTVPCPGPARGR